MSTSDASSESVSNRPILSSMLQNLHIAESDVEQIVKLKKQFECPHFRILIIGRANAGKTTILEKVCGVQQGTEPIIYNQDGKLS
jgi:GTPase SAR1 family protein